MGSLWNRSGVVERYGADDLPARDAKAYFFLGGTTSPMTVFADSGEASAHPHPVVADANGRWPNVFVPYTLSYDVQVLNQFDVELTYTQEIPNPDPVELTVTAPPITNILQTGMAHWEPIQGTKTGYVRCNGRTIGNTVSGATERANTDCSALFVYLWGALADSQASVSGGRGASADADFIAGKTIALPDLRGALPIGLDNMGNTAGGFFPSAVPIVTGDFTTPGSSGGGNTVTLSTAQLPNHTHTFSLTTHSHTYDHYNSLVLAASGPAGNQVWQGVVTANTGSTGSGTPGGGDGTVGATGSGAPASNVPRVITGTWYIKL
jgi:microcystin-dependent protein